MCASRTTPRGRRKLAADKGINLPDSHLRLEAMTDKDREDLAFVVEHADMVALSFANTVDDVRALQKLLAPLGRTGSPASCSRSRRKRGLREPARDAAGGDEGAALRRHDCARRPRRRVRLRAAGRGAGRDPLDLRGRARAGHLGDAGAREPGERGPAFARRDHRRGHGHRAECVMLNKGPYITEAVHMLDDILRRMHGHQAKKSPQLRELRLVSGFRRARKARSMRTTRSAGS